MPALQHFTDRPCAFCTVKFRTDTDSGDRKPAVCIAGVKKVETMWQRFFKRAPAPLYTLAGIVVVLMAEMENSHRQRRRS